MTAFAPTAWENGLAGVSEAERAQIAADVAALSYRDVAEVQRPYRNPGPSGGRRPSFDTIAEVRCRLTRGFVMAREQQIAGGQAGLASATVYCAPATDIRAADRLVVTHPDHPEWPAEHLEVTDAEVRRTVYLELVVTCQRVGAVVT